MEKHLVRAWLLQHPRVECDGKPLNIRLKKAQALLFYLLVQKKATREEAAGLLWGGEENSLARRRLEDYVGGFLPAFSVPGSFEYDQWLEKTRTVLRDEYLLQLDAAAKAALAEGRETDAERFWQRYLQEAPLCETVSVSLMELYRARRDYNRAALVYRSLHKAMSDWLGITPLKETSALYYSIMEEWNAQALTDLSPASVPDLDALTAYHYDQGGDQFHAMQYKVHRFKTYVVFNYALLNGMSREGEVLLNSTPQALDQFHRMERELQELQRLHPGDQALKKVEWYLYYSVGCFCIYRGLYQEGLDAIRRILDDPAAPVELLDLAHEQMTFYGIQTYQTQVMREHIQIALALTQGRDPARYAVNRRYQGYLLVMENRYEKGREELLRSLMLLRDGVTDDVELRLQSAYAHDYIGEAYRKQGSYEKAIGEYQMAIQTIGTFPTSTSKPMFYVNWAQAALAQADYAAARQALAQADRATGYLKEPSGYFQTLFCVYSALFAFADGDAQGCVSYLTQCQQLTDLLIVPCDTGILYLVKGLLRRLWTAWTSPPPPWTAIWTSPARATAPRAAAP